MLLGGNAITPIDWWSAQWVQDRVLAQAHRRGAHAAGLTDGASSTFLFDARPVDELVDPPAVHVDDLVLAVAIGERVADDRQPAEPEQRVAGYGVERSRASQTAEMPSRSSNSSMPTLPSTSHEPSGRFSIARVQARRPPRATSLRRLR